MSDADTTVVQLRELIRYFVDRRDWRQFHTPKNLAMSLAIEAAEIMEHFQWLTHEEVKELLARPAAKRKVADEMADVLSFLLSLSAATGIDLSQAFERKMAANEKKYPAGKVRGRYKKPRRGR